MVKQNPFSQALAEANNRTQDVVPSSDSTTDKSTVNRGGLREDFSTALSKAQSVVSKPSLPPPAPVEKVSLGTRIKDTTRKIGDRLSGFTESVKKEGLGGAIFDLALSKDKQQPKDTIDENTKQFLYYQTYGSGNAIFSKKIVNETGKLLDYANTMGISTRGILAGVENLNPNEKQILKSRGFLDEAGNIKKGKTSVEYAKTVLTLGLFFPSLFTPVSAVSRLATGGKAFKVGKKMIPLADLLDGAIVTGTYNTINTPGLEDIFRDERIAGEATKNFFEGGVAGSLLSIPLSYVKASNLVGFKNLNKAEQEEAKRIYIKLAKRYHPDSLLVTSDEKAFDTIYKKYTAGDIAWLKKLDSAPPVEAEKILNVTFTAKPTLSGKSLTGATTEPVKTAQNTAQPSQALTKSVDNVPTSPKVGAETGVIAKAQTPLEKEGQVPQKQIGKETSDAVEKDPSGVKVGEDINKLEDQVRTQYTDKGEQVEQALAEIWTEMDISEAGKRMFFDQQDTSDLGVISVKSSFPEWVPEELRSKELFNAVMQNLLEPSKLKYPDGNKTKQRALYDAILDELDYRVGVDTTPVRSAIMKEYERIYQRKQKPPAVVEQDQTAVYRGTAGGKRTDAKNEGIKLYRGSKGVVTEETKTFNTVLDVKGYQPQLLQKIADEGNADAKSLLNQAQGRKVDFISADKLIREVYKDSYDAIKYDNTTDNRKAVGIEYHDLKENKFYAEKEETARSYALQSRGLKYSEGIEKAPSTTKVKTLASIRQERKPSDIKSSKIKSPEELSELIDELNKFGQKYAILRKSANIKKASGAFERKGKSDAGKVLIRSTNNDREYLDSLSHELGHAIENGLTGTTNKKTFEVFGDITNDLKNTIEGELLDVTKSLVGEGAFLSDTNYYSRPTELLARFFEMYITNPELLSSKAPNALEAITKQSVVHPMIREYLEVIEKKARLKDKIGFRFLPDLRETYQKVLKSKRLGNIVYHEEVVHRSLVALAKKELGSFIETKFKDVKDSPEQLFRAAESIRVTRNGVPEFGTRDMVETKSEKQARDLEEAGFTLALKETIGDETVMTYTRQRYTEAEAKELYNNLSEEGKQLIEDFTSSIEEAKDFFNREVIKDVYKIESNIEGWVHHYFEKSTTTASSTNKFKLRKAGAKKQRMNKEGYVEDLQKAMTKALVDLQGETLFNDFITRQFARVSKPILEGKNPDAGWVEVVGKLERGVGTRAEKAQTIIVDGKVMTPKQTRYQIPKDIYERYKLIREVTDEASLATRVVQNINKYWAINILFHTGSAGTNFLGGGLQFSSKVLTDFYKELLTGSVAFDSTRKNIGSMLSTLLPKGWLKTPDWIYGADLSNWYGQFMSNDKGVANKTLDSYGDKALKLFSTYERYWKKVISLSEDSMYLSNLGKVGKKGLRLPTEEERRILESVNDAVDLYAFDYDNIPLWLSKMKRSPLGSAVKPFATYPYKYAKHITNMAGAVFDRSLPIEDRLSKLMALTTIMALYGAFSYDRKKKQQTPDATNPEIEIRAKAAGYVFTGFTDKDGNELFIRISKYPYFGLTEAGIQLLRGNADAFNNIMDEMIGSTGPLFNIALTLKGYSSEYNKYDSMPVKLGDSLSSYVPATRILRDVSNALDPYKRKQETFTQKITSLVPTRDPELQEKLHGSIRTVKIPIEGDVKRKIGTPYARTTIDKELRNYWQDILLSALTGIYIKRVNPKDVEAQIIRDEKNKKKREE